MPAQGPLAHSGVMSLPEVVSRREWLTARKQLLAREKELTRRHDTLNAARRELPMVAIGKDYLFEGGEGTVSLAGLFEDSRQLLVYHAMFGPGWDAACPGCTAVMDEISPGLLAHLRSRETAYVVVSRAPYPTIAAYKEAYGWTFPWYSSYGSDFNYDFHVTLDPAVAPVEFNQAELEGINQDGATEVSGLSCFLRDGEAIFHTYSAYARGTEPAIGAYALLDLTPLGRQEDWEEPKGRSGTARPADPSFS
jgi:predicted dithiol-disulfide oxidoreductase (DUF899 family)